jgi:hypothetical protein
MPGELRSEDIEPTDRRLCQMHSMTQLAEARLRTPLGPGAHELKLPFPVKLLTVSFDRDSERTCRVPDVLPVGWSIKIIAQPSTLPGVPG